MIYLGVLGGALLFAPPLSGISVSGLLTQVASTLGVAGAALSMVATVRWSVAHYFAAAASYSAMIANSRGTQCIRLFGTAGIAAIACVVMHGDPQRLMMLSCGAVVIAVWVAIVLTPLHYGKHSRAAWRWASLLWMLCACIGVWLLQQTTAPTLNSLALFIAAILAVAVYLTVAELVAARR